MSLAGKTLFITGASRGIGLAIALRAAQSAISRPMPREAPVMKSVFPARVFFVVMGWPRACLRGTG